MNDLEWEEIQRDSNISILIHYLEMYIGLILRLARISSCPCGGLLPFLRLVLAGRNTLPKKGFLRKACLCLPLAPSPGLSLSSGKTVFENPGGCHQVSSSPDRRTRLQGEGELPESGLQRVHDFNQDFNVVCGKLPNDRYFYKFTRWKGLSHSPIHMLIQVSICWALNHSQSLESHWELAHAFTINYDFCPGLAFYHSDC